VTIQFSHSFLTQVCQPYLASGKFAWHFAKGKLSRDPVFAGLLLRGYFSDHARVLDIGCGQGLLAALLCPDHGAHWPSPLPPQPKDVRYLGIDLMLSDVQRGQKALSFLQGRVELRQGDMCTTAFPASDVVVILDVLHYVNEVAQEDVLTRVRDCLAPGGRLLLRIGDAQGGWPFRFSNWVDQVVTRIRGHKNGRLYCRSLTQWQALLQSLGFTVQTLAMNQGTPFANILLVCESPRP
jgi:SAM-dependent methyltransferase